MYECARPGADERTSARWAWPRGPDYVGGRDLASPRSGDCRTPGPTLVHRHPPRVTRVTLSVETEAESAGREYQVTRADFRTRKVVAAGPMFGAKRTATR